MASQAKLQEVRLYSPWCILCLWCSLHVIAGFTVGSSVFDVVHHLRFRLILRVACCPPILQAHIGHRSPRGSPFEIVTTELFPFNLCKSFHAACLPWLIYFSRTRSPARGTLRPGVDCLPRFSPPVLFTLLQRRISRRSMRRETARSAWLSIL
jgi:hypothetical protein